VMPTSLPARTMLLSGSTDRVEPTDSSRGTDSISPARRQTIRPKFPWPRNLSSKQGAASAQRLIVHHAMPAATGFRVVPHGDGVSGGNSDELSAAGILPGGAAPR
jgi:hypothetical protein